MQIQDFCKQMEMQLDTFEKSVNHIEAKLDAGGTAAKQKILPVVGDIKNLLTELRLQKERLETQCPSDWSEEKADLENLVGQIGSSIDRTWTQLAPGNIGG